MACEVTGGNRCCVSAHVLTGGGNDWERDNSMTRVKEGASMWFRHELSAVACGQGKRSQGADARNV
jgi:hypothetical protein